MPILNLPAASRLFWGGTEATALYRGSRLLWSSGATVGSALGPDVSEFVYNDTTKTLSFKSSEAGTAYWASHPTTTAPSQDQIAASSGSSIYQGGSFAVSAGVNTPSITLTAPTTPTGTRRLSLFVQSAAGGRSTPTNATNFTMV